MADKFSKRPGIFDEDTSGFAFREVFTPLREGPLPRAKPRPSGKGGPSLGFVPPVTPAPIWEVIAFISYGGATTAPAIDTTGADLLVVFSASQGPRVISDSYGNAWTLATAGSNGALYYCQGGVVGPGHTFTVTGQYSSVVVGAFSGSAANPADQVSLSSSDPGSAGPITPSVPNALVVTGYGTNASVPEVPAGFTLLSSVYSATNFGNALAYQTPTTPIATTADWGGDQPIQTIIMSFKPAGSLPASSVWSASDAAANAMTLTNGGLTVMYPGATNWVSVRGTISKNSGQVYVEFAYSAAGVNPGYAAVGVAAATFDIADLVGLSNYSAGFQLANNNNQSTGFTMGVYPNLAVATVGDVIGMAVDFTAQKIWFSLNNNWATLLAKPAPELNDPASGASPNFTFVLATTGPLFPTWSSHGTNSTGGGTWTLQPTAASQKYAPPAGFSAWDSAAPTHSPQALAYLARTVGGNEGGNGANIATLIDGLVADGVWAKLDCLYVLAQQNATDAMLNLVGTSYPMTILGGSPSFTAYVGYVLNNAFLSSGFAPSSAPSPNYTQNSASIGVWMYASRVSSDQSITNTVGSSGIYYNYPSTPNLMIASLNGGQNQTNTPGTTGLYVADRSLSTNYNNYCNGVNQGLGGGASSAVDTGQFILAGTPQTISAAHIGASLGSAGQLALYNRLRTYMTAVGVP